MAVLLQDLPVATLFADFADFVYYAHYVSHNEETLRSMDTALSDFREEVETYLYDHNKTKFTTPKYHMLQHYTEFIRRFGSLLNGDTEVPERMHVSVKAAYRRTNKKGNWEAQMARNLDEVFLVEQLFEQTERAKPLRHLIHGRVRGRQARSRLLSLEQDDIIEVNDHFISIVI